MVHLVHIRHIGTYMANLVHAWHNGSYIADLINIKKERVSDEESERNREGDTDTFPGNPDN